MSGIYGIFDRSGAPVDRGELADMSRRIAFRGPDGGGTWYRGQAGLARACLETATGNAQSVAPISLDGAVWIAADARIDAQAGLRRKLESMGRRIAQDADDAALILHAYHAWGEDSVQHLLGDFAFAIWDETRKRLFCARDHFGVKPFFHAMAGRKFVFSNTFQCVRDHPGVCLDLNESCIADFLLFEMSQDPAATGFTGIFRLPPAHCLTVERDTVRLRPYWALPYASRVVHRKAAREYVEGFRQVLDVAVADRLPRGNAAVLMSGGLDSPAVAALAAPRANGGLRAYTIVYDRMFADEERHYSGLVAGHLGIALHYHVADEYSLFQDFDRLGDGFPEPVQEPFAALDADLARTIAHHSRVVLTGWDGDTLLRESPRHYFRTLLRERDFARFLPVALRFVARERKVVPKGAWKALLGRSRVAREKKSVPTWVHPDFARRLALEDRLANARGDRTSIAHPVRPYAFGTLELLMSLSRFFEFSDPGFTGAPLEHRHPFLDLRVIDYCLALPPYPWCAGKRVLRDAMAGLLPPPVLARPKAGLAGYPHHERLKSGDFRTRPHWRASAKLSRYVNGDKMALMRDGAESPFTTWANMRPLSLDLWLRAQCNTSSKRSEESSHEFQ